MSDWIIANTTLRKKPFSFEGYEFQKQIADDMSRDLVCIKCSQVGLTEVQIRKFLGFLKRNTGLSGIFTLPDDTMFKRLSSTRVKPIINGDKVFNMHTEPVVRQLGLYQIDQSFAYFTGNKESDATSIPADMKLHDELDLSDQEMISLFSSRLQNSNYKISQSFSTPTFIDFGVDAQFKVSDQHEYLHRCEHCNHWNLPDFTREYIHIPGLRADVADFPDLEDEHLRGVDLSQIQVLCEKCHNPLNRHDPTLRQWVPKHPGALIRGYRVLPLSTSRIDPGYILKQMLDHKRKNTMRRWYNTVLAKAHNDENARLTEGLIRAAMVGSSVPDISAISPCVIGIDVGHTCHVVLISLGQSTPIAFLWKQVQAENLIEYVNELRSRYNIIAGCIDRFPETVLANSLRDATDQTIMPVEYRGSSALEFVEDELDTITHIQGNRTSMIDEVAHAVRKGKIKLAGYGHLQSLIIQHLQDMVRIEEPDKEPQWKKLNGNDHFFHALAYGLFAVRMKNAKDFQSDHEIRTMVLCSTASLKAPAITSVGVKPRSRTPMQLGVR